MKRPKNASDRHKQKTVSFRLPQELTSRLRTLAKRNRRTLSGEAQLALEYHLAANGLLRSTVAKHR
jgi:predicted DNA-binding protein